MSKSQHPTLDSGFWRLAQKIDGISEVARAIFCQVAAPPFWSLTLTLGASHGRGKLLKGEGE